MTFHENIGEHYILYFHINCKEYQNVNTKFSHYLEIMRETRNFTLFIVISVIIIVIIALIGSWTDNLQLILISLIIEIILFIIFIFKNLYDFFSTDNWIYLIIAIVSIIILFGLIYYTILITFMIAANKLLNQNVSPITSNTSS